MNFKYFDFPIYQDSTPDLERFYANKDAKFHVFVLKDDWNLENKKLLFKILQAIQVDIENELQILGLESSQSAHIAEHLDFNSQHRFLAFGLNANRLGLQIKTIPYQILRIRELHILFCHKLSDLQNSVANKKLLWSLLKNFKVSEDE